MYGLKEDGYIFPIIFILQWEWNTNFAFSIPVLDLSGGGGLTPPVVPLNPSIRLVK